MLNFNFLPTISATIILFISKFMIKDRIWKNSRKKMRFVCYFYSMKKHVFSISIQFLFFNSLRICFKKKPSIQIIYFNSKYISINYFSMISVNFSRQISHYLLVFLIKLTFCSFYYFFRHVQWVFEKSDYFLKSLCLFCFYFNKKKLNICSKWILICF